MGQLSASARPQIVSGATTGATSALASTPQMDPVSVNNARTGRHASWAANGIATASATSCGRTLARYSASGVPTNTMPAVALARGQIPEAVLDAQTAQKCEYGPYTGGGIPPVCTPRPLTPAEAAAERTRAQTHFAEARRWLASDGPALYAALAATAPIQVLAKAP